MGMTGARSKAQGVAAGDRQASLAVSANTVFDAHARGRDTADLLATAARLLANADAAYGLAKRYSDAGISILSEMLFPSESDSAALVRITAFRCACRERSIRLTGDGFVSEAGAADLLAVAKTTMATWRQEGRIPFRRMPSGAVQYSLADLAAFVGGFAND